MGHEDRGAWDWEQIPRQPVPKEKMSSPPVMYVTQEMWDGALLDLRHAGELLAEAEPSADMDNERCRDWTDATNEWLETYCRLYLQSDGG